MPGIARAWARTNKTAEEAALHVARVLGRAGSATEARKVRSACELAAPDLSLECDRAANVQELVGAPVSARYMASMLPLWQAVTRYDARITSSHNDGTLDLAYDDGDREERASPYYVCLREPGLEGALAAARALASRREIVSSNVREPPASQRRRAAEMGKAGIGNGGSGDGSGGCSGGGSSGSLTEPECSICLQHCYGTSGWGWTPCNMYR